jgi:hypothetical protein
MLMVEGIRHVQAVVVDTLCGTALVISSGAYARGGTYHHAEFVPLKSAATAPAVPGGWVVRYSPEHGHYHLSYR